MAQGGKMCDILDIYTRTALREAHQDHPVTDYAGVRIRILQSIASQ